MKGHTVHWKLYWVFCTLSQICLCYVTRNHYHKERNGPVHFYSGLLRVLELKLIISNCKKDIAKNSYNIL